ncbi:hypothetical protein [Desulfovibrio oxyclinae]|uniref:hypothetical protein n=1 Tax=Desulfovibrio oxyclinae TaxID=63560 RepID=UPI000360CD36|nr:hypothetical protein [Desulfovibrio oxyclinae]
MKKNIITLALVMAVGLAFAASDAMAWGYGCGGYGGYGYNAQSYNTNNKAYQDFLNSTAKLRAEIDADRAELAAVMASPEPDAKKARSLTEQINAKIVKLNEVAAAQNLPTYGMMGPGMGRGMMGPGMGRGMMGYNSYDNGYGYNCPWW